MRHCTHCTGIGVICVLLPSVWDIQLPSLTLYRSLQFYLTIEKALLCGNPLLVEGVTTPFDPALQPLLEMLHTWNNKGGLSLTISMLCTPCIWDGRRHWGGLASYQRSLTRQSQIG